MVETEWFPNYTVLVRLVHIQCGKERCRFLLSLIMQSNNILCAYDPTYSGLETTQMMVHVCVTYHPHNGNYTDDGACLREK